MSVAVNVTEMVSELEDAGIEKAVMVGAVLSEDGASVMFVVALLEAETLFAASFAQAYRVFDPAVPKT